MTLRLPRRALRAAVRCTVAASLLAPVLGAGSPAVAALGPASRAVAAPGPASRAVAAPGPAPRAVAAPAPPSLSVREAILVSAATGQRLYGVAADRPMAIASATKLMTALVTLEHAPLGRRLSEPDYYAAPEDAQIGLVPGERMSVHDLLLALLLPSAADAAWDLAYNVGHRSVSRFVAMMNARAEELGLRHTHYTTPIGVDTPGNYSTPADLAKLATYELAHEPFLARAVAAHSAVLRSGSRQRVVINRNDLVGRVPWIDGVKTGHTLDAGYVLVGSGRRDGMRLVSVVLGTTSEGSRDQNTLALLNWGFASFHLLHPLRRGQVLARPAVHGQPGRRAAVIAGHGVTRMFARRDRVRTRIDVPRELTGPLARGAVVGSATVLANGRPVARIPLVLARGLPAVSSLTVAARFMSRRSTLVSLLVVAAAVAVLLVSRRVWMRRAGSAGRED